MTVALHHVEYGHGTPMLAVHGTGRQDGETGVAEQYALLPHYPRPTYAVLDRSGHNLQIEQPTVFDAMVLEWLDRVAEDGATRVAGG